jgi:hypothetical protein
MEYVVKDFGKKMRWEKYFIRKEWGKSLLE